MPIAAPPFLLRCKNIVPSLKVAGSGQTAAPQFHACAHPLGREHGWPRPPWLPVLRTLGTRPWFGRQLHVGGASQAFDANGKLIDDKIRKLLTEFMVGFAKFVDL